MPLNKKYDNTVDTVVELIKDLNIPVTNKTIATELELHPNYPSLLAISDVLNQFNIANYPFRDITVEQLYTLPCPFIAHTNTRGKEFAVIKSISDTGVHVNDTVLSVDEFSKKFDGTILIVEPSEDAGDHNYAQNKRKQLLNSLRNPVTITCLLIAALLALFFHSSYLPAFSWQIAAITLFKLLGLATSILLLIQSIDANNPLVQKLCQSDTNQNCNVILSSKSAKVFDGLTWSEVGFFYFAGTCFAFLFNTHSIAILQVLAILNLLSLPYTFYSIYHQGFVAKQWCILCCTIQALLWLEFFPLALNLTKPLVMPNATELSSILICFIIPFIAWIWSKPFLLDAQKVQPLNKQLNKFKYNIDLFNTLLTEQPKYATPDAAWSLVLGNQENPEKIITMVSNPYCGPCTHAHKIIDELLAYKSNIQVRFVFVFNDINSEDDKRMVVARQLLALDTTGNKTMVKHALNDWYEHKQRDFTQWKEKYPVSFNGTINESLEKQAEWRKLAEITATPTILVDGYKLPYPYELNDLKYF